MDNTEDSIRELERSLDAFHENLSFWNHPSEYLVFGLLSAIDSFIVVEFQSLKRLKSVGGVQRAKIIHESFSICMRWLLKKLKGRPIIKCKADGNLLDDGGALVLHAKDYAVVSNSFSRYSQGLDRATLSKDGTQLEFDSKSEMTFLGFRETIDLSEHERELARDKTLDAEVQQIFSSVPHYSAEGHIIFTDFDFLDRGSVRRYVRRGFRLDPYLATSTDLGGFTLAEFNRFWEVLTAWSMCATHWYMDYFVQGEDQFKHMPTQVLSRGMFLAIVSSKAIVSVETANKIVDRLTVDGTLSKADVFLQPLVSNDSVVAWSPYVVQLSLHQRNMLKLMSRKADLKKLADNIIGAREIPFTAVMREKMESVGWIVATNRKLPGGYGEVDLLAGSKRFPGELILVEAKTVLEFDEPNEVRQTARDIEGGQDQAARILKWFEQNAATWKATFPEFEWNSAKTILPLVITPRSDPGDDVDQSKVPAMAWSTVNFRLNPESWDSPERWWREIRERKWDVGAPSGDRRFETIKIGDMRFRIPIYEYKDN